MTMVNEMRELGQLAASGDLVAQKAIEMMLLDCQNLTNWQKKGHYTSAIIHAAAQIKNVKAMQMIVLLVKNLPIGIPSGGIELLAGILPEFRPFVMGPIRDLMKFDENTPAFLVGIQSMCNLYLEGALEGSDLNFLADKLDGFVSSDYITSHIVDLVRSELKSRNDAGNNKMETILGELLV